MKVKDFLTLFEDVDPEADISMYERDYGFNEPYLYTQSDGSVVIK